MDHKELNTNSSASTSVSDGSTKFALSSTTLQANRSKPYDVGPNSGKVDATAARPCAIIGPDRVLPSNPDDGMYLKKTPSEAWSSPENVYRRPPEYSSRVSDFQPIRNISPRQTFQENMQRIMVPPTFNSVKSSDESSLKNIKHNMPQEANKYCDVPYNINSVNSEHKGVRNSDIPISNVNSSYTRNMPPPYGWPAGVNVRPLRPYGAPEFYQYQEFPSCAGPRPMTMLRPHRPLHEESAQVLSERLYQDANIRFKPYSIGKEKHQQPRYDYINNYPSPFHPPIPPHKYDLQKTIPGHPYPLYPQVPFKYLDRRVHEPFVDGYHRSHNQQASFNAFHNQVAPPPPYGPIPGNCMQNKTYSEVTSKPLNVNKLQFDNNNKVYLNLEARNKNYSVPENLYYNDVNNSQAMRNEILLPGHSTLNINAMSQHSMYRKDNTLLKSYDYNSNYRSFDQPINHSLQRLPLQFSPNTLAISPDSNTSNDTAHHIGLSQEDCGYVSQSSTTSTRSLDSGNIPIPHDFYRRHSYNNYDIIRNTYNGPLQIPKNKTNPSNKKNIDVRQFLQMWNEVDEEASEGNKDAATHLLAKNFPSQSEIINNHEQLYVLGLVNVPSEELGKYDHIQKISKLPENIKGYNSIEILNQYEELLETPRVSKYNKPTISREFNTLSRNLTDKEVTTKLPRPLSPLDVEAKISQSVIHKEVGCNFEIKPCSPEMLNVEVAAPVHTILGERMIEKVINPIMIQSPNLPEGDKSQDSLNNTSKVACCKMISNQYSSKNSPSISKANNYSVQDLENNAGLCLASLPQLDNDIELNFPEINQQFIKANQMECNTTPTLQTLPHLDLEQTHCFPQKISSDSQQHNLSPQLGVGSVVDKEVSKLSKYRKGKKYDLVGSRNISKQEILKSDDSTTVLQRIDSVIIKNPDNIKSQDIESAKKFNQTCHDIEKESESCYSVLKDESNIQEENLPAETAVDFSLNRTEDETAVSYLNAIDTNVNQHLLNSAALFEESNDIDNISLTTGSFRAQNSEVKLDSTLSAEQVEERQSPYSKPKVIEEQQSCKNHDVYRDQPDSLTTLPVKLSKINAAEHNVLVIRKSATAELTTPTIENHSNSTAQTQQNDTKKIQTPVCDNGLATRHEDNLYINSKNVLQSENKVDVANVDLELVDESDKKMDATVTLNSVIDESAINNVNNKNESDSTKQSEISFISPDATLVNVTNEETVEEVVEVLFDENIDNRNTKYDVYSNMTNHDASKEYKNSVDFNKQNKQTEGLLKLPLICKTNDKITEAVLKKTDVEITISTNAKTEQGEGKVVDVYGSVNMSKIKDLETDVINKDWPIEPPQQDSETNMDVSDLVNVSSKSEEIISNDKNKINLSDLGIEVTEDKQEIVLDSAQVQLQKDDEITTYTSEVECVSDNNFVSMPNDKNATGSLSIETIVETQQNNSNSSQDACRRFESESKRLSGESDINICIVENDTCIFKNETTSIIKSTTKLIESRQEIGIKSKSVESLAEFETNIPAAEIERLSNKSDVNADTEKSGISAENKTTKENSEDNISKYKQEEEKIDTDLNSMTVNSLDIKHNMNTSKLKQEKSETLKVENDSSDSLNSQQNIKLYEKQLNDVLLINGNRRHSQKELFSPWIQKLLMFTEGIYESIEYKHSHKLKDHCSKINSTPLIVENDDFKENNKGAFERSSNEMNDEEPEADKKIDLLNEMEVANVVQNNDDLFSFTAYDENQLIDYDIDNFKAKCEYNEKEYSNISSNMIDSNTTKPRKISKRSFSESAVEEYKDSDNMSFLQPCKKKKKGLKENQRFIESHMITDDICNIIQTNRRNSISTFYNEDNVYIVIDNDLILTDENDDTGKICYTEIAEEFPTNIETTNCEMDLSMTNDSPSDEPHHFCDYSKSIQNSEEKPIEDAWVEDVACIETVFSEDVAENIIIDVQASPKRMDSLDLENMSEESTVFYDSDHIDKIKTIYGRTMYDDNTQLIETLYRTPQMNVNKTLYHIEPQDSEERRTFTSPNNTNKERNLQSEGQCCTDILEPSIVSYNEIHNKENFSETVSLSNSKQRNTDFNDNNDIILNVDRTEEQEDYKVHSCESSNDYSASNVQKENSIYSCSSSPEVSSTTSEEKSSSILLKITNCNGSRVSQINEISSDACKLSYKLTEKREYMNYSSNFSSSRKLITKAAQKYIPPLKETVYDLKVKLPLPQHRLHTLKQLKIAKLEPKIDATTNNCSVKSFKQDLSKKQKLKFEDVLKSIDEINFKKHKDKIKKGKNSIPKVIIKKNENGAHYASSKTSNGREPYNPDLTGRKWQPWVFLEKNSFIDGMAIQNKVKAVYCHRKNSFVLIDKFRKYKSVYNANFVISQPSDTTKKGNLKYTIRLKQI